MKLAVAAVARTFLLVSGGSTPEHPTNIVWIDAEDISPAFGAYGELRLLCRLGA